VGLGEAACLHPVTAEDQDDVLAAIEKGRDLGPVARSGLECAMLDAEARARGIPVYALLGGTNVELVTDMTLPILGAEKMTELAIAWRAKGFSVFKVKVGKDVDEDIRAVEAVARAVPDASFRIDANGGLSARDAIALAARVPRLECFEEPCPDVDQMAAVARALEAPVIADESVKTLADLDRVDADGVNLKLTKSGGPRAVLAIGREAKRRGMRVMIGGMVETRLGMTAAAHVALALGGVDYVDLDTAWLLAEDPYEGGYRASGARYAIPAESGYAVRRARG
jgi:L-alanine-DL-glutamate epimerase-like enolase superfamily enzyme